MTQRPEATQLRNAELSLIRKFEGRVPAGRVTSEVQAVAAEFSGAKVRTFVPILVERAVTERLRSGV